MIEVVFLRYKSTTQIVTRKEEQVMKSETPNMMTVRQVAKTGILSEYALRAMLKEGKLPAIYVGNKALINYDMLCEQIKNLNVSIPVEPKSSTDKK